MSDFFLKIINMSISASWLVLAVVVLRFALKRAPKWVSVLLWGIVAVRLICPFSFESVLSLIPSAETIPIGIEMDTAPAIESGIPAINDVVNPIISQSFTPEPSASANPLQILIPVAAVIWLAGLSVMLIYTAVSYWLLRRKVATAVRLRGNLFQSEHVDSPFVLGILKPRIYLPFQLDGQNFEHVVAHEQAHIRRKDHWWKPLGFLLLATHWFNPLMWLAYILLCRDIELACDEKVIGKLDSESKADYTQALLTCSVSRKTIAACPLAFGEVGVKERVKSVMKYKKPGFWIILAALVICAVVAVCFLTNPLQNDPENPNSNIADFLEGIFQDENTPPIAYTSDFTATILEIHKDHLLVKPSAGTEQYFYAEKILLPIKNMPASPEPVVGDLVYIEYNGSASGGNYTEEPVELGEIYQIHVIRIPELENPPLRILEGGVLYLDTGIESAVKDHEEIDMKFVDATVISNHTVKEHATNHSGYSYHPGSMTGTIHVHVDDSCHIFATEEVWRQLCPTADDPLTDKLRDAPELLATILEIHDGYFIVEPDAQSAERHFADKLAVPIVNLPASPEPMVGDPVLITYFGQMLETDPPQLLDVYRIVVLRAPDLSLPRMIYVNDTLYIDAEVESSREDHSGIFLYTIEYTTDPDKFPDINGQSNFGIGYTYHAGEKEGVIEVNIDGTWFLFAVDGLIQFPAEPC